MKNASAVLCHRYRAWHGGVGEVCRVMGEAEGDIRGTHVKVRRRGSNVIYEILLRNNQKMVVAGLGRSENMQ